MKKLLFILLFALSSSLFTFCKAQQEAGQIVINAGVGYSPEFDGDIELGTTSPSYPIASVNTFGGYGIFGFSSTTPNLGGTIDYGLNKGFSIGVAASYQSEIVGYGPSTIFIFSDKITRVNIATRLLGHLNKKSTDFDDYIGFRIGCSYWHDAPSFTTMTFFNSPNLFIPNFQVVYGMRFYLRDNLNNIGIHFEVGIGEPYLVEGGLTFRISTHKTSDSITDKKKN